MPLGAVEVAVGPIPVVLAQSLQFLAEGNARTAAPSSASAISSRGRPSRAVTRAFRNVRLGTGGDQLEDRAGPIEQRCNDLAARSPLRPGEIPLQRLLLLVLLHRGELAEAAVGAG